MADVVIRCRINGPLVVEGPVTIVDAAGNRFIGRPDKANVALCRCGHSAQKPFCDGSHNRANFQAADMAPPPEAI